MIGFLRLYLRLRWKLLLGALKAAGAKGKLSRLGSVLELVALGFFSLILTVAAFGFLVLTVVGSKSLFGPELGPRALMLVALRLIPFLLLGLLLIMPAVRAGRGSFGGEAGGLTRLLLLPLSRRHLHACEVAANALDPFILAVGPAVLVLGGLIALQVGILGGVVAVLASALLLLALMAWAALLGIALQLLFHDRRRAETALLVAMVIWVSVAMLPGLLDTHWAGERRKAREAAAQQEAAAAETPVVPLSEEPAPEPTKDELAEQHRVRDSERLALAERFPVWLQWLPSESFARTISLTTKGRPFAALPSLLALAAFVAGCWLASLRLWERLIGSPESNSSGAIVSAAGLRLRRFPGLSAEASAVAVATARGFVRTVRGKLALAMTPLLVFMIGFMLSEAQKKVEELSILRGAGQAIGLFAIAMSLLNMLPVLANSFACDRAGFTLQALTPISLRRLVWGKTWGVFLVYAPCLLLTLVAVQVVSRSFDPLQFLESMAAGVSVFALVAPLGAWVSVLFPKQADLGKLGNAGNPHQGAQFLVMFGIGLGMAVTSVVSWLGFALLGSVWGSLLGSVAAMPLCWLLAWPFLESAAGALGKRWETILLTAQGR